MSSKNSSLLMKMIPPAAYWLILPSLLLPLLVIGFPIFDVFRLSFHYVSGFGRVGEFVGWENYIDLWDDEVFIMSIIRTFWWTFFVVGGTVLISVPVSLILNENFYGRGLARSIIMLPWAVSLAMNAVVWKWVFDGNYGMFNYVLNSVGILDGQNLNWFGTPLSAFTIEILVGIVVSIPFTTTILLGGVSSIDRDMYEAATIDGAPPVRQFISLTLPMLKPFINIALILNTIYVFNSFPIIWLMTRGGPSNETHLLITYVYQRAFEFRKLALGSAGSVVMLGILLVVCGIYFLLVGTGKKTK